MILQLNHPHNHHFVLISFKITYCLFVFWKKEKEKKHSNGSPTHGFGHIGASSPTKVDFVLQVPMPSKWRKLSKRKKVKRIIITIIIILLLIIIVGLFNNATILFCLVLCTILLYIFMYCRNGKTLIHWARNLQKYCSMNWFSNSYSNCFLQVSHKQRF